MTPQIPPDAKVETFNLTRDLDLAATCLADDRVPRLPPEDVKVFVESNQRVYVFKFAQSPRYTQIVRLWKRCKEQGESSVNDDMVRYIHAAFRLHKRLVALIRQGVGAKRPVSDAGLFWTDNSKSAAAALAVAGIGEISDSRLSSMILRDGNARGFYLKDRVYIDAFIHPEDYCAANPDAPLAAIVAGFFHRERLRDFVNALPARHVFRDKDDPKKISFIVEPATI